MVESIKSGEYNFAILTIISFTFPVSSDVKHLESEYLIITCCNRFQKSRVVLIGLICLNSLYLHFVKIKLKTL